MRITKHGHSCLVVEHAGLVAVLDPGVYSTLRAAHLQRLDYLLVTHEHPDHMHVPAIRALLHAFPSAQLLTTPSAASLLTREGIAALTKGDKNVAVAPVPHELTLDGAPENVMFTLFGRLAHPGDSHHFHTTADVLALPMQAPWGSFVAAMALAVRLKPAVVIPVHDWHWKGTARRALYKRAQEYLAQRNITFKSMEDGETVEV